MRALRDGLALRQKYRIDPKALVLEVGWGALQPDTGRDRSSAERPATTCQSLSIQKYPFCELTPYQVNRA